MFMRCSPAGREQKRIAGGMAASSSSSSRVHQAKIVGGKGSGKPQIVGPPFTRSLLFRLELRSPSTQRCRQEHDKEKPTRTTSCYVRDPLLVLFLKKDYVSGGRLTSQLGA